MSEARGTRKTREGYVVSDKMQKTVVVRVERRFKHPMYKKTVKRFSKIKVHVDNEQCRVGDFVRVMETRPVSKDKRWRLVEVVRKAQ